MRVVDSLFFALAFLVDSIVCPRDLNPEPPYTVVKLRPAQVPGVLIECETHWLKSNFKFLRTALELYPVEENIFAVMQGHRIIGHTTYVIPGQPHILHGIYGIFGSGWDTIYYHLEDADDEHERKERMSLEARDRLGLNHRLPDNTIFHNLPEHQLRRVYTRRKDNFQILSVVPVITLFRRL